jgi:hypothetical protein
VVPTGAQPSGIVIDAFFASVADAVAGHLAADPTQDVARGPWLVGDNGRLESAGTGEPHIVVRSALERGAVAAAYVTHITGISEDIVAYAVVSDPPNSDVRRSHVTRTADGVVLAPWEYLIV